MTSKPALVSSQGGTYLPFNLSHSHAGFCPEAQPDHLVNRETLATQKHDSGVPSGRAGQEGEQEPCRRKLPERTHGQPVVPPWGSWPWDRQRWVSCEDKSGLRIRGMWALHHFMCCKSFSSFCLSVCLRLYFRAVLGSLQDSEKGVEISHISLALTHVEFPPLLALFTRTVHFLPRMNLHWHITVTLGGIHSTDVDKRIMTYLSL